MIYRRICILDRGGDSARARGLFEEELAARGAALCAPPEEADLRITLEPDEKISRDGFEIRHSHGDIVLLASGIRGFIFAYSMFLRKSEYKKGKSGTGVYLSGDISGRWEPAKPIRGHQLGYRPKNNTYDAWMPGDFYRYYRDMMMFGSNICELMPDGTDDGARNALMKLPANEMLKKCSALADSLDMDVSIWYPNCEDSTPEEGAELRAKVFETLKRVDVMFPPGADPGNYPAKDFVERTVLAARKLKELHPGAQVWPSAQRPKRMPGWGAEFIEELKKLPPEIDGVVTGPNRAFDLEVLRRKLPKEYPIRLYPDITHNVRCEYPVHFPRNDWHFSLAATMGREAINPRPLEYRDIHNKTCRYTAGSVSYSEGCNDDLNKMVWGWLDYDPDASVTEILEDYSRAFFWGADPELAARGILGLEFNWYGDPAENPHIESTLEIFDGLLKKQPGLLSNWRFVACLFRAAGDMAVKLRRVFEQKLCDDALGLLQNGEYRAALKTLKTPYPKRYSDLRAKLFDYAKILFETNGMQLDIENFGASAPDRGAVLETIDNPVTNRRYFQKRLEAMAGLSAGKRKKEIAALLDRHSLLPDEFSYSVSDDGIARFLESPQNGAVEEVYLNFRGDSKSWNNGGIPTELFGVFDFYSFEAEIGGFEYGRDYALLIVAPARKDIPESAVFFVEANGKSVYEGGFGDVRLDPEYDEKWHESKFVSMLFDLPGEVFENGCIRLAFGIRGLGVEFTKFEIRRK